LPSIASRFASIDRISPQRSSVIVFTCSQVHSGGIGNTCALMNSARIPRDPVQSAAILASGAARFRRESFDHLALRVQKFDCAVAGFRDRQP
jgi:hypothetical protein